MRKRILTEAQKRAATEASRRSAARNPEQVKANKRAYYARHRERICAENNAKNAAKPKKPRRVAKGLDPEKARIRRQRWTDKNPGKKNDQQRQRRADNLIQFRASEVEYRRSHKEQLVANQRRWCAKNVETRRAYTRCRRARQRGAEGHHTGDDIAVIRKAQKDRCAYCRVRLRGASSVDHIVALSNGGSNWPSNLQLLCRPCNSSKHTKDAIQYAQSLGRLL